MRILRLLPEQIMTYWDALKMSIIESLPPTADRGEDSLLRVQEQLLIGGMQAWAGIDDDTIDTVYALMTTKTVFDECDNTKNLLIYSLSTVVKPPEALWTDGYRDLSRFARQNGCKKIIAYTNQPSVVLLVQRLGGDVSWTFLSLAVL